MFSGSTRTYGLIGGGLLLLGIVFFFTRAPENEDPDPDVAKIDRLERKKDAAGIAESLNSPREIIVSRAISALGRVKGASARPEIEKLLTDPRPIVRGNAASQYALLVKRDNVQPLIDMLKIEKDLHVRAAVVAALGRSQAWEAFAVVVPELDNANAEVRSAAAAAILKISGLSCGYKESSSVADRRNIIARLRQETPRFKMAYDNYWKNKDSKEHP